MTLSSPPPFVVARQQLQSDVPTFQLRERRSPRARYLRVEIRSGGEVLLVYPRWAARAQALAFLQDRMPWVQEKLQEQRQRERDAGAKSLAWEGNDNLLFQGRLHRLTWGASPGRQPRLEALKDELQLLWPAGRPSSPQQLERALRATLLRWSQTEAEQLIREEAPRLGVEVRQLRINDPKRQWGSCTRDGRITLSWRLLLAPPPVFRYVVVHELCHLQHADHSPRFWALVAQQMPGYDRAQAWLREHGHALHLWLPRRTRVEP